MDLTDGDLRVVEIAKRRLGESEEVRCIVRLGRAKEIAEEAGGFERGGVGQGCRLPVIHGGGGGLMSGGVVPYRSRQVAL